MIVQVEKSIPSSMINNGSLIRDMFCNDREIKYYINNMFITEDDGRNNQVRCNVGQKEKVNITVIGLIKNNYITDDFRLLKNGSELYDKGLREINLKNRTMNITYYNVRVRSIYDYDNQSHTRKLYIDTTHPFYDFLRPILVNQDLIDTADDGNITVKPNDITGNLNGLITLKGIEKVDYNTVSNRKYFTYQVKCKKGDNDGE